MITIESMSIEMAANFPAYSVDDAFAASVLQQIRNNQQWIDIVSSGLKSRLNWKYVKKVEYGVVEEPGTVDYTCEPFIDPNCPACP